LNSHYNIQYGLELENQLGFQKPPIIDDIPRVLQAEIQSCLSKLFRIFF